MNGFRYTTEYCLSWNYHKIKITDSGVVHIKDNSVLKFLVSFGCKTRLTQNLLVPELREKIKRMSDLALLEIKLAFHSCMLIKSVRYRSSVLVKQLQKKNIHDKYLQTSNKKRFRSTKKVELICLWTSNIKMQSGRQENYVRQHKWNHKICLCFHDRTTKSSLTADLFSITI